MNAVHGSMARPQASTVGAVLLAAVIVAAVSVESWNAEALGAQVCYLGVLIGASLAAWAGALRAAPECRRTSQLIAAGVSLNTVGEVVWLVLHLTRAGGDPQVSLADAAWFTSYACLCMALWAVLRGGREAPRVGVTFALDAASIVVTSLLVFWNLSIDGIVSDPSVSAVVRGVWACYPVFDAILLALVVRVLISRSGRSALDGWFAVGVCLWLAADLLYLAMPDRPSAVKLMDAAWMLAPVLMARAAWRLPKAQPMDKPTVPTLPTVPSGARYVPQLLIAVCPVIVPPALALASDAWGGGDDPLQLLVGTVAVSGLALARTARLISSEQRAQREVLVARDEALAASAAKSMFLDNVSHELRTPLTTVLGAAELLHGTALDQRQLALLGKMQLSGQRLLSLVESLLEFTVARAGQPDVHQEWFRLHDLVEEVAATHAAPARGRGLHLSWEVDARVPDEVHGDRARVAQVLGQLVGNAVKFTEVGCVRLSVRVVDGHATGDEIEFRVSDTGIGIAPRDHAPVFEPFHQVDASATRRYGGTGLGLALSRGLTEAMGGTLTLESQLAAGSTFVLRLPLPRRERRPRAPNTPEHRELLLSTLTPRADPCGLRSGHGAVCAVASGYRQTEGVRPADPTPRVEGCESGRCDVSTT